MIIPCEDVITREVRGKKKFGRDQTICMHEHVAIICIIKEHTYPNCHDKPSVLFEAFLGSKCTLLSMLFYDW